MSNTLFDDLNYAGKRTVREGVDLQAMNFTKLKEYIGQTVKVDGFFFTTGKYNEQVVVVGNGAKINMPSRFVEKFKLLEQSEEKLQAMMDGHLILINIQEVPGSNGTKTVGFDFAYAE